MEYLFNYFNCIFSIHIKCKSFKHKISFFIQIINFIAIFVGMMPSMGKKETRPRNNSKVHLECMFIQINYVIVFCFDSWMILYLFCMLVWTRKPDGSPSTTFCFWAACGGGFKCFWRGTFYRWFIENWITVNLFQA